MLLISNAFEKLWSVCAVILFLQQTELNRVFRDIDQEEKIVDESRKALLACKTKCIKLQKQVHISTQCSSTMCILTFH